jgi:hypothetical protein
VVADPLVTVIIYFKQAIDRKTGSNVRRYDRVRSCTTTADGIVLQILTAAGQSYPVNHPSELIDHVQQRWGSVE